MRIILSAFLMISFMINDRTYCRYDTLTTGVYVYVQFININPLVPMPQNKQIKIRQLALTDSYCLNL